MSTTVNLWDTLKDNTDTFSSKVTLKKITTGGESSGGGSDIAIDIRGTLTCASASQKDSQDRTKSYDYFLLTHSLGFTPPSGKDISMYVVILRALQNSSEAFAALPAESNPIEKRWTGQDDHSGYRWSQSSQPATLANSTFLSTDPKGVDNSSTYTTSSSFSIGGNVGFFGSAATGGVDASYTVSHAQTVTIVPTKIVNGSTNDVLQVAFIPQQQKSSDFQPVIQTVLQTVDDGQGTRSKTADDARKIALELRLIILPTEQVKKTHHYVRTDSHWQAMGKALVEIKKDIYDDYLDQAYHEISRVIHIPLPPAPKA